MNDFTFDTFIEKNSVVVVKYQIPGCKHCVEFKPMFDDLVIKFLIEEAEDIKFAEVDCMNMDSLDVCLEQGVDGFPSVMIYKVIFKKL